MAEAGAPTRRRLPRAEREQRMLDAAETAFSEHGFREASMEEIAERSGVTKALVYQYFESKEGLYTACVERARAELFEGLQAVAATATRPLERLFAVVESYFDQLDAHRDRFYILYGEAPTGAVDEMRRRNAEVIAALLEGEGTIRRRDAELLAQLIVGAGEQVGRWWLQHPELPKKRVKQRFAMAIAGAIGALLSP